ncbi:MAG: TrkA family potassium uptake protein, partial [Bdellovibrionales bacterium]|nr:TrkA family potassium uptake protein [Bdellovibrionales bacterium]
VVLEGDATLDETLMSAGIKRASRIVSLLPKDADNLFVVLASRELNPATFILTRADDEVGEKRLTKAGANRVLSPYLVGGQKIADGLLRPYVTDFLDLTSSSDMMIEEIRIPAGSPVVGCSLKKAAIRQKSNIIVAAMIDAGGNMTVNPSGDTVLSDGATLIGIGSKSDFVSLEKMLICADKLEVGE